jgi:hypothetical protein
MATYEYGNLVSAGRSQKYDTGFGATAIGSYKPTDPSWAAALAAAGASGAANTRQTALTASASQFTGALAGEGDIYGKAMAAASQLGGTQVLAQGRLREQEMVNQQADKTFDRQTGRNRMAGVGLLLAGGAGLLFNNDPFKKKAAA